MPNAFVSPFAPRAQASIAALPDHPGYFQLSRAIGRDEHARAYELRFEALHRRGDLADASGRSHADAHDLALNSLTFLLTYGERLVGSTRSSLSSAQRRWPLPAQDVFAAEIADLGKEATIVEASLTVVDTYAAVDPKLALIHLFKAHMVHCAAERADWLVAAVRESQIGFYRRMFNMEILSGAERCPGLLAPRVLMGLEYAEQAPLLVKRIPLLASTEAEERELTRIARN